MVTFLEVAVATAAWFGLALLLAALFRAELEMNAVVSAMVSVSVASIGVLGAVLAQVALDLPFLWTVGGYGLLVVLSAALYELFT